MDRQVLKKICADNGIFLKLFNCKLAHGTLCYMIIIDGYLQIGSDINKAMTQALKLFPPIVLIQGFKMKEVTVFNPHGCFEYSFHDFDVDCLVCMIIRA